MKQGEKILKNLFSSTNKCLTECYDMERAARSTRVDFPDLCQARGWREEQPLLCRQTFRETARHSVEGWCEKPIRDRGCHLLAVPFLVELFGHFFFFLVCPFFASSTCSLRKITCEEEWTLGNLRGQTVDLASGDETVACRTKCSVNRPIDKLLVNLIMYMLLSFWLQTWTYILTVKI